MNINWHNIRPINGDQKEGFEELIAQLARKEDVPNKDRFIRKGKTDAGVECYWILNDNTEWAWQAKYFTSSLGDSQWSQLDKSVKTIIKKHKQINKYFISIPIDPPDARVDGETSMLEKWGKHVTKWTGWANEDNLNIEFIPWWNSDLIERLQKPENYGFVLFWFDKESFTDEWFKRNVETATMNLGNRYTPKINVELEISKIFDGISKDEKFRSQYHDKLDDLLIKIKKIRSNCRDVRLNTFINRLNESCITLNNQFILLTSHENVQFDFNPVKNTLEEISDVFFDFEKRIDELKTLTRDDKKTGDDFDLYNLRQAHSQLREFTHFMESVTVQLYNNPCLLLKGEAGIGKSHLLADIANRRIREVKNSLLLLGQHFNNKDDPWTQILDQLKLNCNSDDFLKALSCKAQLSGARIIIFIDAINEGSGRTFWPDHFNGFILSFSRYKWLGLVLSIRSSYARLLESNIEYLGDSLIRHTHYGFRNVEYEASKLYFNSYNIELPSVPLLHPEFQNPLFLKLFCEGLNKAGHSKIPDGINGISRVLNFYINSVNNRLAEPKKFDYSSGLNIVDKTLKCLVKFKMDKKLYYIPTEEAIVIVSDLQRKYNITGNLIDALIAEGVLSKNLFWKDDNSYKEGIYISYERLEDHLITSEILDNILSENILNEFKENGLLFDFVKDKASINRYKGIIEAISIQLPEKYGIELYEVVDDYKTNYAVADAFVNSLLWRKNELIIKEQVIDYINDTVMRFKGTHDLFWDTLIAISINPKHYFNANKTHEILSECSLAERDAWWTQLIHNWFDDETSLKRLIDWAWSIEDKNHISDDSIELASIMLSWFLTSTNRKLRDSATKALICLLENRAHLIIKVLKTFESVNDPYVYERLFSVAYGCVLRSARKENLKELSEYIYETIFDKDKVYPHILLRDYARGVIEYTIHLGIKLNIDETKIRPPYKSDFPQIPSDYEMIKYEIDYKSEDVDGQRWGVNSIIRSMEVEHSRDGKVAMYGHFGRYVFQNNFQYWDDLNLVDLKNIAIKRIFELGYDVEKHGKFDHNLSNWNRYYVVTERIGKKYQWIAMHELLAKVSDKYKIKAPLSYEKDKKLIDFSGPWELFVRDIDPSTIRRVDKRSTLEIHPSLSYNNWNIDNKEWLKYISDLPEPGEIIEDKSHEWVMLEGYINSAEQKKLGNEQYSVPQKQFSFLIKSYLVTNEQYDLISTWLSNKIIMGGWAPESHDRYGLFNREFYWSPGFKFFKKEYDGGEESSIIYDREKDRSIGEVIVTTESYLWGAQYDFSKDEAFNLLKPCSKLVNGLNLNYRINESYMYSETSELICFDNSEGNSNNSCLYFRKKALSDFLINNGYKIIWTVLSEKISSADREITMDDGQLHQVSTNLLMAK